MNKYYDNGELITMPHMEQEAWYPNYQALMELCLRNLETTEKLGIEELMSDFNKDYNNTFGKQYSNQEQLLRWCVLHSERLDSFRQSYLDSLDRLK